MWEILLSLEPLSQFASIFISLRYLPEREKTANPFLTKGVGRKKKEKEKSFFPDLFKHFTLRLDPNG